MSAFSKLAKDSNTILLPANTGDVTNMVAQVGVVGGILSLAGGGEGGSLVGPGPFLSFLMALSCPLGPGHLQHADQAPTCEEGGRGAPSPHGPPASRRGGAQGRTGQFQLAGLEGSRTCGLPSSLGRRSPSSLVPYFVFGFKSCNKWYRCCCSTSPGAWEHHLSPRCLTPNGDHAS